MVNYLFTSKFKHVLNIVLLFGCFKVSKEITNYGITLFTESTKKEEKKEQETEVPKSFSMSLNE